MPYSEAEHKLFNSLVKKYGEKKANKVYHAMLNSGKYDKIFSAKSKARRRIKQSLKEHNLG